MKIKEGKRYVRRDGNITGKMRARAGKHGYLFEDPKTDASYQTSGNFWGSGSTASEDLIKQHNPKVKYKVSKKFIKEAHSSACTQWKEKIEAEFPKLFPKKEDLVVGKWYKLTQDYADLKKGQVFTFDRYQCVTNPTFAVVGHGIYLSTPNHRDYGKSYLAPAAENLIPATTQEVEAALISEAKKRGFKKGTAFKNLSGAIQTVSAVNHYLSSRHNGLCCGNTPENEWNLPNCQSNTYLFKEGVWATIIKEPQTKQMTVAEVSKLAGCKVEIIE